MWPKLSTLNLNQYLTFGASDLVGFCARRASWGGFQLSLKDTLPECCQATNINFDVHFIHVSSHFVSNDDMFVTLSTSTSI